MIRKIDISEVPRRTTNWNNVLTQELREFVDSDWSAAEVDISKYRNAESARQAYKTAAVRAKLPVLPMARGGRLFLVRVNEP